MGQDDCTGEIKAGANLFSWKYELIILALWIGCAQVMVIASVGVMRLEAILALAGSLGLFVSVAASLKRIERFRWIWKAGVIICVIGFALSLLTFIQSRDWETTYIDTILIESYGFDIFKTEDQVAFREKLNTGEINWMDAQRRRAKITKEVPGSVRLWGFKIKRYLRFMFWPPLTYISISQHSER
jgi:hypothetical protein